MAANKSIPCRQRRKSLPGSPLSCRRITSPKPSTSAKSLLSKAAPKCCFWPRWNGTDMAAEDFFNRWSRSGKDEDDKQMPAGASLAQQEQAMPIKADSAPHSPPPQAVLDKLRPDAVFSACLSIVVDDSVRRSAMKKLFSDPHFNVMDGLD